MRTVNAVGADGDADGFSGGHGDAHIEAELGDIAEGGINDDIDGK